MVFPVINAEPAISTAKEQKKEEGSPTETDGMNAIKKQNTFNLHSLLLCSEKQTFNNYS